METQSVFDVAIELTAAMLRNTQFSSEVHPIQGRSGVVWRENHARHEASSGSSGKSSARRFPADFDHQSQRLRCGIDQPQRSGKGPDGARPYRDGARRKQSCHAQSVDRTWCLSRKAPTCRGHQKDKTQTRQRGKTAFEREQEDRKVTSASSTCRHAPDPGRMGIFKVENFDLKQAGENRAGQKF